MLRSFAVSAKCIAIASSGFSGGAVMSIDWFGDRGVADKCRPPGLPVSPWTTLALRFGMAAQDAHAWSPTCA